VSVSAGPVAGVDPGRPSGPKWNCTEPSCTIRVGPSLGQQKVADDADLLGIPPLVVAFGIGDECGRLGIGKGPRYCMTPKQRSRCATPAALAWGSPAGRVPGEEEVTNHDGTAACSFDILAD